MKEEKGYRFHIGGASVVLILVVLALSIFALLSVRASYHEEKLARKTAEAVSSYYAADGTAEELYASADAILKQEAGAGDWKEALQKQFEEDGRAQNVSIEADLIHYEVPVTEASRLVVELDAGVQKGTGLRVLVWRMVTEEQGDYGEAEIEIWDGEVD